MVDWYPDLSKHPWEIQQFGRIVFDNLYFLRDRVNNLPPQPLTQEQIAQLKQSIQFGGYSPINVSGLPGTLGEPQITKFNQGTYAQRPAVTVADNGLAYFATDQNALYEVRVGTWVWVAGTMFGTITPDLRPVLVTGDMGFRFVATDTLDEFSWDGSSWKRALTTAAESWVGPSSTAGWYFKNGNVGHGTTNPLFPVHIRKLGAFPTSAMVDANDADAGGYGAQWLFRSKTSGAVSNTWTTGTNVTANANAFEFFNDSIGASVLRLLLDGTVVVPSGNITLLTALATVDGVDVSAHDHSGAGKGGTIAVGSVTGAAAAASITAHTIPLAKLTTLGTNGSITVNAQGIVTGYVDPT